MEGVLTTFGPQNGPEASDRPSGIFQEPQRLVPVSALDFAEGPGGFEFWPPAVKFGALASMFQVAAAPVLGWGIRGLRGPQYRQRAGRTVLMGSRMCLAISSSLPNLASAARSLAIIASFHAFTRRVPCRGMGHLALQRA